MSLGCSLHKCFSAFFPTLFCFIFPCRLGSNKIITLENKHLLRTTKCSSHISKWLFFPSHWWKGSTRILFFGLHSENLVGLLEVKLTKVWDPTEVGHRSFFLSSWSMLRLQQLVSYLLSILPVVGFQQWFLLLVSCDSRYPRLCSLQGSGLPCDLSSLRDLRLLTFSFFSFFLVVRIGGLSSSFC